MFFLSRLAMVAIGFVAPIWLQAQVIAPTVLHPGDAVRISVFRQPELSGEFWIAADSTIRHPLYQTVKVAGVPLDVAKARLAAFLARFQETPQFVVEPLLHVSIGGAVGQPNLYTFRPEVTVAQAVVQAGGLTPDARLNDVRLQRDGQTHSVDLTRPDRGLAREGIRSGDQIMVLERRRGFYSFVVPAATLATTLITLIAVLGR